MLHFWVRTDRGLLYSVIVIMNLTTGKTTCSVLGLVSFKALIEESEMKKFPDNDLLRHLRLVTQDAEKCASVAQQLLNGKRQTRYIFLTI